MNEKDTQKQEGTASEELGESALDTKQTSDDKGTTIPPDATDELTKIFAIPGRPELKLTGQQVATAIGRAELADKWQGEVDKATADKQTAVERAVQAEAKLQAMEQNAILTERLEDAGLLGTKPSASAGSTEGWADEEPAESQLGAKEVAKIVDNITRQTADTKFEDLDSKVEAAVGKLFQTERDADQQLKQYEAFMVAEGRARRAALSQDYPSADADRIEEIAILQDSAINAWTEAQQAASLGDRELALTKVQERDAYANRRNTLQVETAMTQAAAEKKTEFEQQLETGDYKGVEIPAELSDDAPREMIFDPDEKKKRRGLIAQWVADRGAARERAKLAQGE